MLQRNKYVRRKVVPQSCGGADRPSPRAYGWSGLELPAHEAIVPLGGDIWGESMTVESIVIWLLVGAIAGWLAGMVVKGGGFGLIGDIIVGIVGGLIAGWLLPRIGIVIGGGEFIGPIINAFIGAVILLIILRLIRR